MFKTLIAFGCSFTYGDELLDPNIKSGEPCNSRYNDDYRNSHCYAGLVADHYGFNFVNTASPGGSLESMRYALYWAKQNFEPNETLFLAGLTQAHRNSYFDDTFTDVEWNKFQHSTWLKNNNDSDWNKLNNLWLKLCLCDEWEQYNLDLTVSCFENVNAILLPVFETESDFTSKNKTDFVLEQILDKEHFAKNGHPNESGHQIVAERLINYIDSVKLF